MLKTNSLLRYMNGVNKGMEINTAEMFYKALVRAVFDYGSVIFFPRQESKRKRLERTQYQGLRTALGYRMSTPTNVVLEEAKSQRKNNLFSEKPTNKNDDLGKKS